MFEHSLFQRYRGQTYCPPDLLSFVPEDFRDAFCIAGCLSTSLLVNLRTRQFAD